MSLYGEVLAELVRQNLGEQIVSLVMAALKGRDEVEKVLAGGYVETAGMDKEEESDLPSSIYLQDITISGFRGIGPQALLELDPHPGLTVIVGRNGSGKSSFAEGLEVLLTGDNLRWAGKPSTWKQGWRNLHHGDTPRIKAKFQVEGVNGISAVERSWSSDAEFAEGVSQAQHHGQKRTDLAGFGWVEPLELYRPILSYNELGLSTTTPSELFDSLSKVLGLEPLATATKVFSKSRRPREVFENEERRERLDCLVPALEELDDERATKILTELRKHKKDLDTVAALATETDTVQEDRRVLMEIMVPSREEVEQVAERFAQACSALTNLSGTDAEHAKRVVRVLKSALAYRQHGEELCPVCGQGMLDEKWHQETSHEIERLQDLASRFLEAESRLERAIKR